MYTLRGLGAVEQVAPSHDEFANVLLNNPARQTPPSAPAVSQAPVGTPTPQQGCQMLFTQWAGANPVLARCLNGDDARYLINLCAASIGDPVKQPKMFQDVQNYIGAACARTAPPPPIPPALPPPPPPPPTSNQPPPITPPPRQDFPGDNTPTFPPPSDTSAPPAKSLLRQVGPIVGIGLLAAVGLTYARKRALTKKRRRK